MNLVLFTLVIFFSEIISTLFHQFQGFSPVFKNIFSFCERKFWINSFWHLDLDSIWFIFQNWFGLLTLFFRLIDSFTQIIFLGLINIIAIITIFLNVHSYEIWLFNFIFHFWGRFFCIRRRFSSWRFGSFILLLHQFLVLLFPFFLKFLFFEFLFLFLCFEFLFLFLLLLFCFFFLFCLFLFLLWKKSTSSVDIF